MKVSFDDIVARNTRKTRANFAVSAGERSREESGNSKVKEDRKRRKEKKKGKDEFRKQKRVQSNDEKV